MLGLFSKRKGTIRSGKTSAAPVFVDRLEDRTFLSTTVVHPATAVVSKLLVTIQVLASTTPTGTFKSALTVTPGEKIYYEVVATLAPVGTSYVDGARTYKITTKMAHPKGVSGFDGINSLLFSLADTGAFTGTFATPVLATNPATGDSYAGGTGVTPGVAKSSTVIGVFAAQAPGRFAAPIVAEQVITGSFTTPSKLTSGKTSTIGGTVTGGSIEINSNSKTGRGTHVFITSADLSIVSFAKLTLTAK